MPRRTRPAAAGQQPQALVQARREAVHPESLDAGGCELNRERNPVQLPADVGDDRSVLVGQFKFPQTLRRTLDKQLHRVKRKRFGRAKMVRWGPARQRRQPLHIFAFNPQRLAAGCQDVDVCRTPEDSHARVAAASMTCSQLSSTSTSRRSLSAATRPGTGSSE